MLDPIRADGSRGAGWPWRDIAYLPQDAGLDRQFPITVQELVGLGSYGRARGLFGAVSRPRAGSRRTRR